MPLKTTRRLFLAQSLAAGAGVALAVPSLARSARRGPEGLILTWDELSPGVHAMIDINTGGNVAVVVSGEEALVIDSKFPFLGPALRQDAGELGGQTITLINTHHHGDHTGGNAAFRAGEHKLTGLAHTNAVDRIRSQFESYQQAAKGGPRRVNGFAPDNERLNQMARDTATRAPGLTAEDWVPSLGLGDEGTITIGETDITYAQHGPGHTDNDLVLSIDGGRVIHTGDLVFNGLHPFFDRSGGVNARGWINALEQVLRACNPDTIVIPGHGPAGDRDTVKTQLHYLEQIVEKVQAEIDAGKTWEQTIEKSWDFMDGLGFEGIRQRAIGAVYNELTG